MAEASSVFAGAIKEWENLTSQLGQHEPTVWFTNIFAALFAWLLLRLCAKIANDQSARYQNYLIVCLGALLGWALGMFFSPYGAQDEPVFAQMGKLVSVFMSGYAVSKLDRFIEASMFDGKQPKVESWIRIGLFAGSLLLALLTVISNRLYFRPDVPETGFSIVTASTLARFDNGAATVQTIQRIADLVYGDVFHPDGFRASP